MYTIIHPMEPFDASRGTTIHFTWNGNQFNKARCIIKDKETNAKVYDNTVDTMKTEFILPGNATSNLNNGKQYIAYISVFDAHDNTESDLQDPGMLFLCLTTPTFNLSISNGDVIRTSSFLVSLTYSQVEKEILNSFSITLYSNQKILLQSSGEVFDTTALTYLISGLENGKQYYVKATGLTLNGMELKTDYISFTVAYSQRQIFTTIEANNLPDIGAIELRSNIISTEGVSIKEVTYIDNRYADLRDNSVTFDIGYEVSGDNSHVFAFNSPNINQKIVSLVDATGLMNIDCYYREGSFEDSNGRKAIIEMAANTSGVTYVIYSNYIDIPTPNQNIVFCLNRVNNYFNIKATLAAK